MKTILLRVLAVVLSAPIHNETRVARRNVQTINFSKPTPWRPRATGHVVAGYALAKETPMMMLGSLEPTLFYKMATWLTCKTLNRRTWTWRQKETCETVSSISTHFGKYITQSATDLEYVSLIEEELQSPNMFYYKNKHDLNYSGVNVKFVKAFLAYKKI
jgi:hypothetical protein